jgi:hypothetical protein
MVSKLQFEQLNTRTSLITKIIFFILEKFANIYLKSDSTFCTFLHRSNVLLDIVDDDWAAEKLPDEGEE